MTSMYIVCYKDFSEPENATPCGVFSEHSDALKECRRLAEQTLKELNDTLKGLREEYKDYGPFKGQIQIDEEDNAVYVCVEIEDDLGWVDELISKKTGFYIQEFTLNEASKGESFS